MRKSIEKEIKIHGALRHENILEFIGAAMVDLSTPQKYHPGWYMLLELAAGGDLFDKIRKCIFHIKVVFANNASS
jgi:serine/threonine-protein kinase Chk1